MGKGVAGGGVEGEGSGWGGWGGRGREWMERGGRGREWMGGGMGKGVREGVCEKDRKRDGGGI